MNTTLEILKKGRALIADEKNWTTSVMARDSDGCRVEWNDDRACSFCSLAALRKVVSTHNTDTCENHPMDVLEDEMANSIVFFSDHHSHREVLAAWDRAIEKQEFRESMSW